mmetsp:Transcript_13332/g.34963  ORF Transcript_13332/g.34963 Transcript_13332/m.34963 type:complete len:104 (-) Transcript_13332:1290-1601(-)
MPRTDGIPLESIFTAANPEAVDLVKRMLRFNPWERISAEEALKHPYLREHHFSDDEVCKTIFYLRENIDQSFFQLTADHPFAFDFEQNELELNELKGNVYFEA